jgi:hypothetical protein
LIASGSEDSKDFRHVSSLVHNRRLLNIRGIWWEIRAEDNWGVNLQQMAMFIYSSRWRIVGSEQADG